MVPESHHGHQGNQGHQGHQGHWAIEGPQRLQVGPFSRLTGHFNNLIGLDPFS